MLQFFRKYQRFFFAIVTVVIVISFSFFGTFSTMGQGESMKPDRVLLQTSDGSSVTEREMALICQLISTTGWNPSQIVEKEILSTGIGLLMARQHFEAIKPDLESRLEAIRNYRPYVHPLYPQFSAEAVWQRFVPQLTQQFALLKEKSDQVTVETLAVLFQLYLSERSLPPQFLKQVLAYQLQQQGLPVDPRLQSGDLSLFGFHSLEDWFGKTFVSLLGQYVIQGARLAEARGCKVGMDMVRQNFNQQIQGEDYRGVIYSMGGDERLILKTWQSILLFQELDHQVSSQVQLDALLGQRFHDYSKESLTLELYELPESLRLSSLSDLFELQVYLEAGSELTDQKVEIEYVSVNHRDLLRGISVKQTWDWEILDANWQKLSTQFPKWCPLASHAAVVRMQQLDKLSKEDRWAVDQFAREQILKEQPERIQRAFDLATSSQITVSLRPEGLGPLNLADPTAFIAKLHTSSQFEYTDAQNKELRVTVLNRALEKQTLSFEQAKQEGMLSKMLERRLKGKAGRQIFQNLLRQIETACIELGIPVPEKEIPDSFYVRNRFVADVHKMRQQCAQGTAWTDGGVLGWKKRVEKIERNNPLSFARQEMFAVPLHGWSEVVSIQPGTPAFYQVIGQDKPPAGGVEQESAFLVLDAKRRFALQVILPTLKDSL